MMEWVVNKSKYSEVVSITGQDSNEEFRKV